MATFRGPVYTISEFQDGERDVPNEARYASAADVRFSAARAALAARQLIASGEPLSEAWRFGILQAIDYYDSARRRGDLGAEVFAAEPPRTGSLEIDAAFAALADHLARRDGWLTPAWASQATRVVDRWYPAGPFHVQYFQDEADRESPPEFRCRGIYVSLVDLERV